MSGNKQWFVSNDRFIDIICCLVLSLTIFISLKYQRQTSGGFSRELTYDFMNGKLNLRPGNVYGGEDRKINISMWIHCVVCAALDALLIIYLLRRLHVSGWRSKNDQSMFQCVRIASCELCWIRHWVLSMALCHVSTIHVQCHVLGENMQPTATWQVHRLVPTLHTSTSTHRQYGGESFAKKLWTRC